MRVYELAKQHKLDNNAVLAALGEAGLTKGSNAAQGVDEGPATEVLVEAGLIVRRGRKPSGHSRVNATTMKDNKTGIKFVVGSNQNDLYTKAASALSEELGLDRNSTQVRNRAYRVCTRARQAGLIEPTTRAGNPQGRKAWDKNAVSRN